MILLIVCLSDKDFFLAVCAVTQYTYLKACNVYKPCIIVLIVVVANIYLRCNLLWTEEELVQHFPVSWCDSLSLGTGEAAARGWLLQLCRVID
jgi:hypothetical protein